MSNVMRYKYGETNPVNIAVDSATVIEIGDLVYLNTDDALPASSQADQSSEAANQRLFASNFLGVAAQQSQSGDTASIRVATSGVFEFVCPSGTFEIGDLVGCDEATSGTALEDQQVAAVTAEDLAIGKVAKTVSSADTAVLVDIKSKVMSLANLGSSDTYIPDGTPQSLSGAGAALLTSYQTIWTTTSTDALTLADATRLGHLKLINMIVDGGTGTLTPTTFADGTSIAFADAGDYVILKWISTGWTVIQSGNFVDGITSPATT